MAYANRANLPLGEGEEYELRAVDVRLYNIDEPRDAKLVAWRLECFERAGLTPVVASTLALRRDLDRVDVERLASMPGITSALVLEILT